MVVEAAVIEYPISDEKLRAGKDYLAGLKKLGLHPETFSWAYDYKTGNHCILMTWSGLEKYGPLSLSKLLFTAYRTSLLPREINPLSVFIYSERHMIGKMLTEGWGDEATNAIYGERLGGLPPNLPKEEVEQRADFYLHKSWVMKWQKQRRPSIKVGADWKKFQANVSRMAA